MPANAQQWAAGQIARFGKQIIGVVAANDGTAGGAIAAFKAAGVDPVPPVTGNDAEIAALQRIIAGDQYNTISKPSEIVARAAADVAVQLLKGETPKATTTLFDSPSQLFVPAVVTAENLKAEIIDKKIQTAAELCTGRLCRGLQEARHPVGPDRRHVPGHTRAGPLRRRTNPAANPVTPGRGRRVAHRLLLHRILGRRQ